MNTRDVPQGFQVDIGFPDEFSDFIAEIVYEGTFICLISQERGPDSPEIMFNDPSMNAKAVKFGLRDFQRTLAYALRRLYELRKQ
jgi:hypothetical protein